jgi:uncharacterized protein (DUF58 family)
MVLRHFTSFVLLLLLIAALLRVDFFFTIVYFLVAVLVLSQLWLKRATEHLRVERRLAERAFTGDRVTVELVVRNTGWLPVPWLEVSERLPVALQAVPFQRQVVSLGPREERRFRYTLNCRRRGYYTVGPLSARAGDLFGIVRRELNWSEAPHLIVYPRVVPLQRLGLPTYSPLVALPARTPLFEDPSRVMGVRDYRRGDSPRRMHWTATARTGRLLVKQYQPAIARETLICLDLDEGDYARERRFEAPELAIVAAASLANHVVVREGLPVGLLTAAHDPLAGERARFALPPRPERAQLLHLLEILARVEVAPGDDFVALLRRARATLSWGATIAVITGRESDDLRDALLELRRGGFAVALILVQADPAPGGGIDLPGVPVLRLRGVEDLERGR